MVDKSVEKLDKIEIWAKKENTPAHVFAGVKVNEGWELGKEVTLNEYQAATKRFLYSPMKGV